MQGRRLLKQRHNIGRDVKLGLATLSVAVCMGLAGCTGLSSTASLEQPPSGASGPRWSLVTLHSIAGASPAFTQQLTRQLNVRSQEDSIALVVDPAVNSEVRLEGLLSLSREKDRDGRSSLRYAWIIRDAKGTALQTIEGVEPVKLPISEQDPWSWVPTAVVVAIADRAVAAVGPLLRRGDIVSATITTAPKLP